MQNPAVDICNVNFTYKGHQTQLFTNLCLTIGQGDRFGLFGPNGAGKTTLMGLMTGLLHGWQGEIKLLGNTVKNQRKIINKLFGLVPQDLSLYEELTVVENLAFFGAWSGLTKKNVGVRTAELLEILHLNDAANKPISKLSGGMKRKVNLAVGVMHEPSILFLDEPTVGVDVQARHDIINYLLALNQAGTTLIYTSHQLSEAQDLCKHIALINQGKIVATGKLEHLLNQHQQQGLEGLFLNLTGSSNINA